MRKKVRDIIDIHFRLRRHQLFFFIGISFLTISVLAGFAVYSYYLQHYYDSSTNGSEAKEVQQKTVPADVAVKIKEEATASAVFRVPILMYHYVEYVQDKGDKIRRSLDTLPVTLEGQIKTLADAGFTFMTNSELADVLDGKSKLPSKPVLLTFDDGYRDFYTDAFPILKKYNAKATAYVISGFLNRANHLQDSQLDEIIKSGLVEIGAHTIHHAWLKGQPLKNVVTEVLGSKTELEQKFHIRIESFAYPYGAFDSQAFEAVQAAGYKSAVSTIPGVSQSPINRFFLSRLRPGARTGQILLNFLSQQKFEPY